MEQQPKRRLRLRCQLLASWKRGGFHQHRVQICLEQSITTLEHLEDAETLIKAATVEHSYDIVVITCLKPLNFRT